MVLLCKENNIKDNRNQILKLIQQKKASNEIFKLPPKSLKETEIINDDKNNIDLSELTDNDYKLILNSIIK
jgi:hypothetical protein